MLEVTEGEIIADMTHFASLINEYRGLGLKVAIDDFGAGYSGLNLLVNFQPDQIKLDMFLVRGIEAHGPRQAIVRAIDQACRDLGVDVQSRVSNRFRRFTTQSVPELGRPEASVYGVRDNLPEGQMIS